MCGSLVQRRRLFLETRYAIWLRIIIQSSCSFIYIIYIYTQTLLEQLRRDDRKWRAAEEKEDEETSAGGRDTRRCGRDIRRGARTNDGVPQLQQPPPPVLENDQRGGPPVRSRWIRNHGWGRGTGTGVFIIERDRWLQRENKPPPVRHTRVPCVCTVLIINTHTAARRRRILAARIRASVYNKYIYIERERQRKRERDTVNVYRGRSGNGRGPIFTQSGVEDEGRRSYG